MPPNKHCVRVGILVHGRLQTAGQVFLEGSVVDDWDTEGVVVPVVALSATFGNTLDLLDVVDLEACIGTLLSLDQQCDQHRPLGVCMNAASSAMLKSSQKQRGAVGGLQLERLANIIALGRGVLGGWPLDDEDVLWLDQLFLDTRRSEEDVVTLANGGLQLLLSGLMAQFRAGSCHLPLRRCQSPIPSCRSCGTVLE